MSSRYSCLEARLFANSVIDPETGCWLWLGHCNWKGYGRITLRVPRMVRPKGKGRRKVRKLVPVPHMVHRVAYELFRETRIPAELTLDHLADRCPNKNCFNPFHLEEVTRTVNTLRMQHVRRHGRNWSAVAFPDHAAQV